MIVDRRGDKRVKERGRGMRNEPVIPKGIYTKGIKQETQVGQS